jgi:hypothetical protein
VGALGLYDAAARAVPDNPEALAAFAALASVAIAQTQLHDREALVRARLEALDRASQRLAAERSLDGVLQRIVEPWRGCALGEAAALSVAVLGPPLVRWGERAVAFRTRKEFTLLAYLALTGTPQPREHLAALFWPDHDPATARKVVRTTLSRLRHDLAVAGGTPMAALTLLRTGRDALGREVVGLARAGTPALTLDVEAHNTLRPSSTVAPAARAHTLQNASSREGSTLAE